MIVCFLVQTMPPPSGVRGTSLQYLTRCLIVSDVEVLVVSCRVYDVLWLSTAGHCLARVLENPDTQCQINLYQMFHKSIFKIGGAAPSDQVNAQSQIAWLIGCSPPSFRAGVGSTYLNFLEAY